MNTTRQLWRHSPSTPPQLLALGDRGYPVGKRLERFQRGHHPLHTDAVSVRLHHWNELSARLLAQGHRIVPKVRDVDVEPGARWQRIY